MDKLFYTNEAKTEKSAVPQGSDLPEIYFELLEYDLSSLPKGLTIYDIEWTSEGITTNLETAEAKAEKLAQIKALKVARETALQNNTVTMLGHEFDARPKDLSNIQLGIDKNETLWPDVNDYMVDVVNSDLQYLLITGIDQGEKIWDDYKAAVKAIQ